MPAIARHGTGVLTPVIVVTRAARAAREHHDGAALSVLHRGDPIPSKSSLDLGLAEVGLRQGCRLAAVHCKAAAGGEGRRVRCEESYRPGHLLRCPGPTQRVGPKQTAEAFAVLPDGLVSVRTKATSA
jgi:hypothetical protein